MPTRRQLIERRAGWRCEYCRAPQRVCGYRFHIEHIVPRVLGGADDLSNLALACGPCNLSKGARVRGVDPLTGASAPLFHPRTDRWQAHFEWAPDGRTLVGRTPIGRSTIIALDMNAAIRLEARTDWRELGLLP